MCRPSGEVDLEERGARCGRRARARLPRQTDVSVEVDAPDDLPPVRGDRDELIQVFQNLIHNGDQIWQARRPCVGRR